MTYELEEHEDDTSDTAAPSFDYNEYVAREWLAKHGKVAISREAITDINFEVSSQSGWRLRIDIVGKEATTDAFNEIASE